MFVSCFEYIFVSLLYVFRGPTQRTSTREYFCWGGKGYLEGMVGNPSLVIIT